jgi:hypothetical protein
MSELVADNQTAFIHGRCIQDNFLLVQEAAKALHMKKEASILLKVDITKAFDSISWSFLLSVLWQRGFGARWLWWVTLLLRSVMTPKWRRSIIVPFDKEKVVKPTRS